MFISGAFEVLYIFSSELFPTVVRNTGMGTSSACARAGSMLSPYIAQLVSVKWYIKLLVEQQLKTVYNKDHNNNYIFAVLLSYNFFNTHYKPKHVNASSL